MNVAIMGFGVVGSGVAEVIAQNADHISEQGLGDLRLSHILDIREFPGHAFSRYMTKDVNDILSDDETRIVVETMGGLHPAYEFTRLCLENGKSVVTSNKELVAKKGFALLELARANNVNFLFEAAVGGGIPLIRPLSLCLAANRVQEIAGILNGTSNFILSKMITDGMAFGDALRLAQEKGYAEKDPTADVEGIDACRKICILSSLGFGRHIFPDQAPCEGITKITLSDVAYARSGGYKIKLLGRSIRRESDGKVCAFVAPHLVHEESPLANAEDVFNAIQVTGDSIGDVMFYGRGAGKLPTASAVVADIMDIVKSKGKKRISWGPGGDDTVFPLDEISSRWYLRVKGDFSMDGAKRLRNGDAHDGESAFISDEHLTVGQVKEKLSGLEIQALYRVLD